MQANCNGGTGGTGGKGSNDGHDRNATAPTIALVTPCHNEHDNLDALVASIDEQDLAPVRWIIVDDGSSDDTFARAQKLTGHLRWVEVHRRSGDTRKRSFESKARAVNAAAGHLKGVEFSYLACIDADVVLPPDFLSVAVSKFESDLSLGITGGRFVHPVKGQLRERREPQSHVPGPAQVFRRKVFDEIGGYLELQHGGIDTVANYTARHHGWKTSTFPDLTFHHTRQLGTGGGRSLLRAAFHLGQQDWDLGNLGLFELLKVAKDVREQPILLGAVVRLAGYCESALRRGDRSTPPLVRDFIRAEQRQRLRAAVPNGIGKSQ
ncbi:MAG: glycosyltransferase family 2 protein [Acidimicrobiales bacterium]